MPAKPLLRQLHFWTEALHRKPELDRVVRDDEMHGFVGDEIAKHRVGREYETPIERQIPTRGATVGGQLVVKPLQGMATRLIQRDPGVAQVPLFQL